ncbi:MAG: C40 family peptidase [Trinickia sp.]|uniref:C40 family peptidase n=1 Tax=Trinickia sp. TaxID=2571163 RepID=UPI003F7F4ABE
MRRLALLASVSLLLAACSSVPTNTARSNAPGEAWRTKPRGLPNFVDHSIGREEISVQAMSLVGVPYRWAGNTPASGFDCSGLVQYVFGRAADIKLPRTTAAMSERGEPIDPDEIAAGDLVFFNTSGRPHSHVGIYVGKLRFVNAPSTGGTVRIDYLTNPYWAKRFDGIRRMAPPVGQPAPFDAPTYLAAPRQPTAPVSTARTEAGPAEDVETPAQALARMQHYKPLSERDDPWADTSAPTAAAADADAASANDDPIARFATSK